MINHEYKYIFVHIPKTAGSSIRHILPESDEWKFPGGHAPARTYYGFFLRNFPVNKVAKVPLGLGKWNEYTKFAFIRNPWARFVSAYNFLKNGGKGNRESIVIKNEVIDKHPSIKHFICNEVVTDSDVLNGDEDLIDGDICYRLYHFKSQYQMLNHVETNQLLIDNIYRFEELQQGIASMLKKIGLPVKALPHLKKSTDVKPYTDYYDDETREIIAIKYKKDIELFGYKFDE